MQATYESESFPVQLIVIFPNNTGDQWRTGRTFCGQVGMSINKAIVKQNIDCHAMSKLKLNNLWSMPSCSLCANKNIVII